MASDSKQISVMFPAAVSNALEKHCGNGVRDFIRAAVAEKLAKDFGENVSPILTRGEQGRRTDLERLRRKIAEIRAEENAHYERIKTLYAIATDGGGGGNAKNPAPNPAKQ